MFASAAVLLLAASPLLTTALPATLNTRQVLPGYQTQCLHDTAIGFDDGPFSFTQDLVNEMTSQSTYATLFVNGYNWDCIYSEASVAALRHAFEYGFTIGSHTWNHYAITQGTNEQLGAQLDLVETALLKILGVKPALFRPPYGDINDEKIAYLNSRGYTVVGWSTDTGDSAGASVDSQIATLSNAVPGNLFLAHETYPTTAGQVIPPAISNLVSRGIKVIPVDQCLNIPAYQGGWSGYGTRDSTWTCDGKPAPGAGF